MIQRLTIVLEWEQARHQERARSETVLRRLIDEVRSQVGRTVVPPLELVVCAAGADLAAVRLSLLESLGAAAELFDVRYLAAVTDYYAVKNQGVAEATGDIVVFLDSDVIPELGWLSNLIAPFEDEQVELVSGNTYVESTDTYSRTFALTWNFPLRSTHDEVGPLTTLRANNLALRRDTARRFPFPSMPDTSRRTCQMLKQQMLRRGVTMVSAHGARVAHPAPAGASGFLRRALSQGRDRVLLAGPGRDRALSATGRRLVIHLRASLAALWSNHRAVDLSPEALPLAAVIAVVFALCCTAGELLTLVNRDFMIHRFRV